ncbi:MAG: S-layer protein, partial [Candidatus Heimdallarchaeaceae archaeon]
MKLKKAIKKIVALGAGASMVGATMLGALAAADLSTYPEPFVKDGVFNALIVVGESAATQDVLGAIDIATSLQYASKTVETVEGGTAVTLEGDSYRIDKASNFVEIGENVSSVVSAGSPTIGESQLSGLSGGTFRNSKGAFDYNEYLELPLSAAVSFTTDPDDDTDTPAFYLVLDSGTQAYKYSVEFPVALEADLGSTPSTSISQLENKKITLVGEEYTITSAKLTNGDDIELTLMAGALQDVLEEGTSKTYTLNGKDYEVSLDYVGTVGTTSSCKFTINGEVTDTLQEGETYRTIDGTEIGIRDIMENEAGEAAGGDKVEFFLGAKKLVIDDDDYDDTTASGNNIEYGSETIDDVTGSVFGSNTSSVIKINSLRFQWILADDVYIPVGGKLSEHQEEEGDLFANFDIAFEGLTTSPTEDIVLSPRGDNRYTIEFTNKAGDEISVPYVDADYDNSGSVKYGYGSKTLHICEPRTTNASTNHGIPSNFTIKKNDYFIVTSGSPPTKDLNTYLLQYKGYVNTSGSETVSFKNVGTGETFETTNLVGNTDTSTWGNTSATAHGYIKIGTDSWRFWL